jgi:hypothetical protein
MLFLLRCFLSFPCIWITFVSDPPILDHLRITTQSPPRTRKMSFLLLLGQATATFLVSFIIGYLPLVLRSLSANKGEDGKVVKGVSVVGMGLLVGSALTIIIPEYVFRFLGLWISLRSFPIAWTLFLSIPFPSFNPSYPSNPIQTPQNSVRGIPMEEG